MSHFYLLKKMRERGISRLRNSTSEFYAWELFERKCCYMAIEHIFNNNLWWRQNWLISFEGNRSFLWQGTIYFGLYHKKFLTAAKGLETEGMGFSFRSRSLFSVTAHVGSKFLCLPFLCYSLFVSLWNSFKFPFSISIINTALIEGG